MLEGERIRLRPILEADFARIAQWGRDDELNYLLEGDYPSTVGECRPWLLKAKSDPREKMYAIALRSDNSIIGDISLNHIAWRSKEAELGIRIGDRDYWGRGIGTEAVSLILSYAFGTLKLQRVYLRVYAYNQRAIKCYLKCGFKGEGYVERRNAQDELCRILLMSVTAKDYWARAGICAAEKATS